MVIGDRLRAGAEVLIPDDVVAGVGDVAVVVVVIPDLGVVELGLVAPECDPAVGDYVVGDAVGATGWYLAFLPASGRVGPSRFDRSRPRAPDVPLPGGAVAPV